MTVAELISLLSACPPEAVVSVWDPMLDQPCHVQAPLDVAASGSVVLIESNARLVTEEDAS